MTGIQMVDLKRQYARMKGDVDSAIQRVIDSTGFIGGPEVTGFAEELAEYLDAKHCIPCANGTDALQIALMALGLQPGDEVITPSFTYIATVEVVALLRAKPVFAEVHPEYFTLDLESVRRCITPRTKAIIPVHLYGQSVDMAPLLELAAEHGIPVIEDNAQAIGGDYTFPDGRTAKTGTMGDIGCTSFFPSKNLGCYGDGGAMFTNNDELAAKLRVIANHGQSKRYYHDTVGCNSRLDAVQAAVLRVKLPQLDDYNNRRRAAADFYDAAFAQHPAIQTPARAPYAKHVFHQYTLKLTGADRDAVHNALASRGVPTMIYYPVPSHKQAMLAEVMDGVPQMPVTEELNRQVLSLPIHTELTEEELRFISTEVIAAVDAHRTA